MSATRVIGLHSGHDASYCILEDGVIVEHVELERHARVKEPPGDSIEMFTKYNNCFDNVTALSTCHLDSGLKSYKDSWNKIKHIAPLHVVGHHAAHAAHAFYSSPYEDAVIITTDGGGFEDNTANAVSITAWYANKNVFKQLYTVPITNPGANLGGLWSRFTRYVFNYESGWPQGHQAGTVMALAALGDPKPYFEVIRSFAYERFHEIDIHPHGHIKGMSVKDPRRPVHPILGAYEQIARDSECDRHNIAASLQAVTEMIVNEHVKNALSIVPPVNGICLSGGVSLNSVLTGRIRSKYDAFVPPVPYDGGLCLGSAQYTWHVNLKNPKTKLHSYPTPYLGVLYTKQDVIDAISSCPSVTSRETTDDEVVDLLIAGEIVSVFNGRAESGRRALGNRSILADPRHPGMKNHVNDKVKHRQWFRPFAPSILREHVAEWFEFDIDSPYMGFVAKWIPNKMDFVPAVVHFDGTARLQTVTNEMNAWYHSFITKFYQKTFVPILLNTSFNDREPIVDSPVHAINCFLGTEIDKLYFPEFGLLVNKA